MEDNLKTKHMSVQELRSSSTLLKSIKKCLTQKCRIVKKNEKMNENFKSQHFYFLVDTFSFIGI